MIQSLTFRLADAMPHEVVDGWRAELGLTLSAPGFNRAGWKWRKHAGRDAGAPSAAAPSVAAPGAGAASLEARMDTREIELLERIAKYEDEGHGACWLRDEYVAQLVERSLLRFDQQRYGLLAWCIMPNHVHVMIETKEGFPLDRVLHSWKSYTATEANKIVGRNGEFWQREYRDRYIRNQEHFENAIRYIENNPVKAGLVKLATDWQFSSARLRKRALGAPASLPASAAKDKHAGKDAGAPSGGPSAQPGLPS